MKLTKFDMQLASLISEIILKEEEMNLNIRAGRGYSTGHPHIKKQFKPTYGYEEINDNYEEKQEPVKISKAFQGRENEVD